jgi:hypothetical protein
MGKVFSKPKAVHPEQRSDEAPPIIRKPMPEGLKASLESQKTIRVPRTEVEKAALKNMKKWKRGNEQPPPPSFKKGGKVKKTGLALVHKGEVVVPVHRVETVDKALKKAGLKPLKK